MTNINQILKGQIERFDRLKNLNQDWNCGLSSESIEKFLQSCQQEIIQHFREEIKKIISCKGCNGIGGYLGSNLGYAECNDCGGDGHCLYNREGEKLQDILNLIK